MVFSPIIRLNRPRSVGVLGVSVFDLQKCSDLTEYVCGGEMVSVFQSKRTFIRVFVELLILVSLAGQGERVSRLFSLDF